MTKTLKDLSKKPLTDKDIKKIEYFKKERQWHKETRQKISAYKMLIGEAKKKGKENKVSEYTKKLNWYKDTTYAGKPVTKSLAEIDNEIRKIKGLAPYLIFDMNIGTPIKVNLRTLNKEPNPAGYILMKAKSTLDKIIEREKIKGFMPLGSIEGLESFSDNILQTNIWYTEGLASFGTKEDVEEAALMDNETPILMDFLLNPEYHLLFTI